MHNFILIFLIFGLIMCSWWFVGKNCSFVSSPSEKNEYEMRNYVFHLHGLIWMHKLYMHVSFCLQNIPMNIARCMLYIIALILGPVIDITQFFMVMLRFSSNILIWKVSYDIWCIIFECMKNKHVCVSTKD